MRRLLYLILICLTLSCSESEERRMALQRAVSVMNDAPDSALHILDSLGKYESQFGRHFRMQCGLHRLNAFNKLDTLFRSTEEAQQYADYFDSHGTPNERILAYYLLGRAYYDMGESPMALECYQTAISKADTTAKDCDYLQMSRVYSQMAYIFWQQNLLNRNVECLNKAINSAWMARDTISALMNMSHKADVYDALQMYDSIIAVCDTVFESFRKYNCRNNAASVLGSSIESLIKNGNIRKAKCYIDIYESESGFFDSNGNIDSGREIYYYIKGRYYLAINKQDSAEYYFRKELYDGKDFNNQNAASWGLALLFQQQNRPDSAAKYAMYSYEMNDSVYAQMSTKEIEKTYSLYNYIHYQESALLERLKAENEQKKVITLSLLFVILILFVVYYVRRERQKEKYRRLKYEENISSLAQLQSDVVMLKQQKEHLERMLSDERDGRIKQNRESESFGLYAEALQQTIARKEERISELQSNILSLTLKDENEYTLPLPELLQHNNYMSLHKLVVKGLPPTKEQWQDITIMVQDVFPNFYEFIQSKKVCLNEKQFNTCLLLRLYVKPRTIANMLGVSPAYISKIRSVMCPVLFGFKGTSKDFDSRIMQIC